MLTADLPSYAGRHPTLSQAADCFRATGIIPTEISLRIVCPRDVLQKVVWYIAVAIRLHSPRVVLFVFERTRNELAEDRFDFFLVAWRIDDPLLFRPISDARCEAEVHIA